MQEQTRNNLSKFINDNTLLQSLNRSEQLSVAISLAVITFENVKDKGNEPYIGHCQRVAGGFLEDEPEKIVSYLHDVFEDTGLDVGDILYGIGFDEDIILATEAITRTKQESYEEYIKRVANNEIARRVKVADLKDNLNITRLDSLDDSDLKRIAIYHKSFKYLTKHSWEEIADEIS